MLMGRLSGTGLLALQVLLMPHGFRGTEMSQNMPQSFFKEGCLMKHLKECLVEHILRGLEGFPFEKSKAEL